MKSLELDPEQRIRELSRGTRAKVALLMAVATRPEVLLLDDPTSGLDPLVRREVLESIVEGFPAKGGAVVYASHLIHDLERIADRIAVLDEGRVVLEGTVEELHAGFVRASAVFEDDAPTDAATKVEGLRVLESFARGRTLTLVTDAAPAALEQTLRGLGAQSVETESLSLEDLLIALLREGKEVAA
jgi:ABC-2 type transport system ATP-binding protein